MSEEYRRYMRSPEWQAVRRRFVASNMPKLCAGCDKPWALSDNLHHRSYRRLGHERLDDLVPLCWPCHEWIHEYIGPDWKRLYQATMNGLRVRRRELGLPPRAFSQRP